ncbi:hypothetical protein NI385_16530 [Vibrio parahaemolyticus]|nr:hypothetical protein NI385_16530 [Vibrio parahaemolyticus]
MCGIFGHVGKTPNIELLTDLSVLASHRGTDMCGFCINGETKHFLGRQIPDLSEYAGGYMLGHYRLYNGVGTFDKLEMAHPITFGDTTIIHNGAVDEPELLSERFGIIGETHDTKIIAMALESVRDASSVFAFSGNHAIAIIKNSVFTISVKNMPLFGRWENDDFYFCSKRFERAERIGNREIELMIS